MASSKAERIGSISRDDRVIEELKAGYKPKRVTDFNIEDDLIDLTSDVIVLGEEERGESSSEGRKHQSAAVKPSRKKRKPLIEEVAIIDSSDSELPNESSIRALKAKAPVIIIADNPSPPPHSPSSESTPKDAPKSSLKCPICLEEGIKDAASTNCGHIACYECLKESLAASKKYSRRGGVPCPVCRKSLTGKQPFHRIYL